MRLTLSKNHKPFFFKELRDEDEQQVIKMLTFLEKESIEEEVVRKVASHFGMRPKEITEIGDNHQEITKARQIVCCRLRQYYGLTYEAIADVFIGGYGHTDARRNVQQGKKKYMKDYEKIFPTKVVSNAF